MQNSSSSGQASIGWGTLSNTVYQLQYTRDLLIPGWTSIGGTTATLSTSLAVIDPDAIDPCRFYRLIRIVQ